MRPRYANRTVSMVGTVGTVSTVSGRSPVPVR